MKGNWKHGLSGTALYRRWASMIGRCKWQTHTSWKWYGKQGVKVCERWLSFTNFVADMGYPPFAGATIERIDPIGHYSPDNCRWSSQKEQQRNRRNNLLLSFNGKTQSAASWAEELKLPVNRIHCRKERGWSDERALSEPPRMTTLTIVEFKKPEDKQ